MIAHEDLETLTERSHQSCAANIQHIIRDSCTLDGELSSCSLNRIETVTIETNHETYECSIG